MQSLDDAGVSATQATTLATANQALKAHFERAVELLEARPSPPKNSCRGGAGLGPPAKQLAPRARLPGSCFRYASGLCPPAGPFCQHIDEALLFPANGAESANAAFADGLPDRMRDRARSLYFGHFCSPTLRDHASRNIAPASGALPDFTEVRRR